MDDTLDKVIELFEPDPKRFLRAGYNMYTSLIDHTEKLTEDTLTEKKAEF